MATSGDVTVRLPRALMHHWDAPSFVELPGRTLAEVLAAMDARFPGLAARILDDQGRVRRFVSIFVNEERVEEGDPARVAVAAGDKVYVVPSVAGG